MRHYVHIGTGNYHAKTARLYDDFGLFTTDPTITADVADIFNSLTGSPARATTARCWWRPATCATGCSRRSRPTIDGRARRQAARIVMKMNSLVDPLHRGALRGSRAGVPVDLIVRGICCLRPGAGARRAASAWCRWSAASSSTRAS